MQMLSGILASVKESANYIRMPNIMDEMIQVLNLRYSHIQRKCTIYKYMNIQKLKPENSERTSFERIPKMDRQNTTHTPTHTYTK